jgi:hypothetical protein
MSEDTLKMHREEMKIEGDRTLHNYTFTDSEGKLLSPEPTLPPVAAKPQGGNLKPEQGENRKG